MVTESFGLNGLLAYRRFQIPNVQTVLEMTNAKEAILKFLLTTDCFTKELKDLINDPECVVALKVNGGGWSIEAVTEAQGAYRKKALEIPNHVMD